MHKQFMHGDLVRHVTGGPVMVVLSQDAGGYLICQWYCEISGKFLDLNFSASLLEIVKPALNQDVPQIGQS